MKGFTLVELSIVLVIIGLLIGGILVAQSMIETARVTRVISEIQQFDVAVQQFKVKYNSLPGDSNKFPGGGNNNGLIEEGLIGCCGTQSTEEFKGENRNFWPMLQLNGFVIPGISGQLPLLSKHVGDIPVRTRGTDQNVPSVSIGKNTGVVPFTRISRVTAGGTPFIGMFITPTDFEPGNFYFLANFDKMTSHNIISGGGATRNWKESIPVSAALALDLKLDDGNPITGRVLNGIYINSTYQTNCTQQRNSTSYRVS